MRRTKKVGVSALDVNRSRSKLMKDMKVRVSVGNDAKAGDPPQVHAERS